MAGGYVLLSLAAAMLLLAVSLVGQTQSSRPTIGERLAVATAFMAGCGLGLVLALKPGRSCSQKGGRGAGGPDRASQRRMVGHHPDCGRFGPNVTSFRGRAHCAGCLGLAMGCVLSIAAMGAALAIAPSDARSGTWMAAAGMVLVAACLLEVALRPSAPLLHILSNLALVVGFLLVTLGVLTATSNGAYGLLAVLVSFLWMDARIQLSEWRNSRVCDACGEPCRAY